MKKISAAWRVPPDYEDAVVVVLVLGVRGNVCAAGAARHYDDGDGAPALGWRCVSGNVAPAVRCFFVLFRRRVVIDADSVAGLPKRSDLECHDPCKSPDDTHGRRRDGEKKDGHKGLDACYMEGSAHYAYI